MERNEAVMMLKMGTQGVGKQQSQKFHVTCKCDLQRLVKGRHATDLSFGGRERSV